jgi:hypothetical protein
MSRSRIQLSGHYRKPFCNLVQSMPLANSGSTQGLCNKPRQHYQPCVGAPGDAREIFGLIQRVVRAAMCAAGTVNLTLLLDFSCVQVRSGPRIFNGLEPPGNS